MSHHRNAICQTSGKVRYRERRDVKFALRRADGDRHQARLNDVVCSRRETTSYSCADCNGWHLTSQTSQPTWSLRAVPSARLAVRLPGAAAEAIRRMARQTELTAAAT